MNVTWRFTFLHRNHFSLQQWCRSAINIYIKPTYIYSAETTCVDGVNVRQHFIACFSLGIFYIVGSVYSPFSFVTVYVTFWNRMFSGCNFKSIFRFAIGLRLNQFAASKFTHDDDD